MEARTTTALLEDLLDPANEAVWREFDARYHPILIGLARRLGLGDEDAADAAQEALTQFLKSYRAGKYTPDRGRLSSWMLGIARNCIIDQQRARAARREQRGLSAAGHIADEHQLENLWDTECERALLSRAMVRLREDTRTNPRTIRAFEMLAFDQASPADVARELEFNVEEVYVAKHRCLKRLRPIVQDLRSAYEIAL